MNNVFFFVLWCMWVLIILLIVFYGIVIIGLMFVFGIDVEGCLVVLFSFFYVFYFISYMVIIIGFGEILNVFFDV